jgi:hypothetical protein
MPSGFLGPLLIERTGAAEQQGQHRGQLLNEMSFLGVAPHHQKFLGVRWTAALL